MTKLTLINALGFWDKAIPEFYALLFRKDLQSFEPKLEKIPLIVIFYWALTSNLIFLSLESFTLGLHLNPEESYLGLYLKSSVFLFFIMVLSKFTFNINTAKSILIVELFTAPLIFILLFVLSYKGTTDPFIFENLSLIIHALFFFNISYRYSSLRL